MPTQDPVTHTFSVKVRGSAIAGECEFNRDKKGSYEIDGHSDRMSFEMIKDFSAIMDLCKSIDEKYKEQGIANGLIEIVIKEIETEE